MLGLKLYGYQSTRSQKVAWTLEELGLAYDYVSCHPASLPLSFKHLNPYMKLPVLEDQGRCIFETSAICSYLCDRQGANKLVPRPGTIERAKHDQWLSVIQCELEPALWMKVKHKFVLPADLRVKDRRLRESLAHEVKLTLGPIRDELKSSEWLTGHNFTLADVFLAYCLDWSRQYGFWSDPVLARYLQSAQSREAFARAVGRTQAESSRTGA